MLNWNKLLNHGRRRPTKKNVDDKRNEFDRDYDRVIYSSSFRRLKDKAQVFPLERNDFVRTRLAHSLEVSTLGRSFGVDVADSLKKTIKPQDLDGKDFHEWKSEISAILSTTCILHDLGNPPFGHFGEESIRSWFKNWFKKREADGLESLPKHQKNDFQTFEGNAQTLRIVTYLQALEDNKGINLTFGTLGSLLKYTADSSCLETKKGKSKEKCGYFQSEKNTFEEIQSRNGTDGQRHPLVFLMEAADDLAYSAIDVEDALQKNAVSCETFVDFMDQILVEKEHKDILGRFKDNRIRLRKEWDAPIYNYIATQLFRIDATGYMFRSCVDAFCENYSSIMNKDFDIELIKASKAKDFYLALQGFAKKHVYTDTRVLKLEVVGCKVIHGLLEVFVGAVTSSDRFQLKTEEGKLYQLISPHLRSLLNKHGNKEDLYQRLQLVTDYVSGMTDNYALSLYQNLTGIKLGSF